jgi:hypothetical protein
MTLPEGLVCFVKAACPTCDGGFWVALADNSRTWATILLAPSLLIRLRDPEALNTEQDGMDAGGPTEL